MLKDAIPGLSDLAFSEKLLLLEELWDNVAGQTSEIPVWDWQQKELDCRYQDYLKHPDEGASWPEVKKSLLESL